jgi:hypothetical protein
VLGSLVVMVFLWSREMMLHLGDEQEQAFDSQKDLTP